MAQIPIEQPAGNTRQEKNEQPLRRFVFLLMIVMAAVMIGAGLFLPAENAPPPAGTQNTDQSQQAANAPAGQAPPELVKQIDDLKSRLEKNPKDTQALISLADIYAMVATTNKDYFNQAEGLYKQAIDAEPKNAVAYSHLGDLYYDSQSWNLSANYYSRALEIVPKDTGVRSKLAVSYISQGLFNQAIQELKQVIDQQPDDIQAHYALGFAYVLNTPPDTQAAIEQWEIVVKLDPNSQEAQDALKQIAKYKK